MVKYSCNWNLKRVKKRQQDKTSDGQEFSVLATDPQPTYPRTSASYA